MSSLPTGLDLQQPGPVDATGGIVRFVERVEGDDYHVGRFGAHR